MVKDIIFCLALVILLLEVLRLNRTIAHAKKAMRLTFDTQLSASMANVCDAVNAKINVLNEKCNVADDKCNMANRQIDRIIEVVKVQDTQIAMLGDQSKRILERVLLADSSINRRVDGLYELLNRKPK